MSKQAVDAQQAGLGVGMGFVVGQGGAQVGFHVHDARLGQFGQHALRRRHQLDRAAQAHRRAVFALHLARADHEQVARARHDVDPVARVQQAHRALQRHAGGVQPDDFAANASERQVGCRSHSSHIDGEIKPHRPFTHQVQHTRRHAFHAFAPAPVHVLRVHGQRAEHVARHDLRLTGQQPGVQTRRQRGLQRGQRRTVQRLRRGQLGGQGGRGVQPGQHAARRAQVGPVRQHQAAVLLEQRCPAAVGAQRFGHLAPQGQRSPAQAGDLGAGVVQLRDGAEHAGGGEARRKRCAAHQLTGWRSLWPRSRVEHRDMVPRAGQLPREQAAEHTRASDADACHGSDLGRDG